MRHATFLARLAVAACLVAGSAGAADAPFLQFTLEGPGVAKHTATFDVTGWSGTKRSANGASALQGAVSREGRRYSQVSFSLGGDTPYLVLGLFEDGKPEEGPDSNSLALRSRPADGIEARLDVVRTVAEPKVGSGTFSGVLVVTNRDSRPPSERTYRVSDGRYRFVAER